MTGFITYHPIVNFVYFLFVIGFSVFFMHPVCLILSLICGLIYLYILNGITKQNLLLICFMLLAPAVINPLFNHEGATVISYLPSQNPLTLESVLYGLASSAMLTSVMIWFICFGRVMESDKLMYLFGKTAPSLALVFSMTLKFIPDFYDKLRKIAFARRASGEAHGGIIQKAKNALCILSVMLTWSLESSIESSNSMKSRGYSLTGRSFYSIYTFKKRDGLALSAICLFGLYTLYAQSKGAVYFSYFPYIKYEASAISISAFISYFALLAIPVAAELWEDIKWNNLKSKI